MKNENELMVTMIVSQDTIEGLLYELLENKLFTKQQLSSVNKTIAIAVFKELFNDGKEINVSSGFVASKASFEIMSSMVACPGDILITISFENLPEKQKEIIRNGELKMFDVNETSASEDDISNFSNVLNEIEDIYCELNIEDLEKQFGFNTIGNVFKNYLS